MILIFSVFAFGQTEKKVKVKKSKGEKELIIIQDTIVIKGDHKAKKFNIIKSMDGDSSKYVIWVEAQDKNDGDNIEIIISEDEDIQVFTDEKGNKKVKTVIVKSSGDGEEKTYEILIDGDEHGDIHKEMISFSDDSLTEKKIFKTKNHKMIMLDGDDNEFIVKGGKHDINWTSKDGENKLIIKKMGEDGELETIELKDFDQEKIDSILKSHDIDIKLFKLDDLQEGNGEMKVIVKKTGDSEETVDVFFDSEDTKGRHKIYISEDGNHNHMAKELKGKHNWVSKGESRFVIKMDEDGEIETIEMDDLNREKIDSILKAHHIEIDMENMEGLHTGHGNVNVFVKKGGEQKFITKEIHGDHEWTNDGKAKIIIKSDKDGDEKIIELNDFDKEKIDSILKSLDIELDVHALIDMDDKGHRKIKMFIDEDGNIQKDVNIEVFVTDSMDLDSEHTTVWVEKLEGEDGEKMLKKRMKGDGEMNMSIVSFIMRDLNEEEKAVVQTKGIWKEGKELKINEFKLESDIKNDLMKFKVIFDSKSKVKLEIYDNNLSSLDSKELEPVDGWITYENKFSESLDGNYYLLIKQKKKTLIKVLEISK